MNEKPPRKSRVKFSRSNKTPTEMKSLCCYFRLLLRAAGLVAALSQLTASAQEAPVGALKKEGPPVAQTVSPLQKDALQTQAEQESGPQTPSQEVIRPRKYLWADDAAVKPPKMPSDNPFGMALFPEFHFAAHDQGTLADLCRELAAAAGPKTKIYLNGEVMKLRVPDLTLKNARVGEVLDAVKLANPGMTWKYELWNNINEYYVGMLAPASAIVCHVFRFPTLASGDKGGKEASKNREDPMTKMFDHIFSTAEGAIRFRDTKRRTMTHEILPVAGLDMELHPETRLLFVVSTPENIELVGAIVKDLGVEDLGPAVSSSPPLLGAASLTTLAPSKAAAPRSWVPDLDDPALPEFSFEADFNAPWGCFLMPDQGNLARFCHQLAAAAGPKTRIYVSSEAMKLRAPNLALKNVRVDQVLHALELAEPRVAWTWESAPDCLATNPDWDATVSEYYVGVLAPASSIVCHLFRTPDQPLDKSGGSAALEKRQKAFDEMYMLVCSEAMKAIQFRDSERRVMTHDILPMAGFDTEGQGESRLLTVASTQENIELTSAIVRALGGEDLGPAHPPFQSPTAVR